MLAEDKETMHDDPVRFPISDREFHATLDQACGNGLPVDAVCDFYDDALEFRRLALKRPGAIANSVTEHRAILKALRTGKPAAAETAAHRHLDQVRKTTLDEMGTR